jgi:hypothetical protein
VCRHRFAARPRLLPDAGTVDDIINAASSINCRKVVAGGCLDGILAAVCVTREPESFPGSNLLGIRVDDIGGLAATSNRGEIEPVVNPWMDGLYRELTGQSDQNRMSSDR